MDRSPIDDTKLVMRGKDIDAIDIHMKESPKSPVAVIGKRINEFASLIPLQTPGKTNNRTIRASSPFHEVQGDSDTHSRTTNSREDQLRDHERIHDLDRAYLHNNGGINRNSVDSSRGSSVKVSTASGYQPEAIGVRSIAEMRTSPGVGVRNSPRRNGFTHNSPTSAGYPGYGAISASPNHPTGMYYAGVPVGQPFFHPAPGMPGTAAPGMPGAGYFYPGQPMYYPYPYPGMPGGQYHPSSSTLKDPNRPDYTSMKEADREDALAMFKTKFQILRKNYPEKKFELFDSKMSLDAIHDLYEIHLKSISADSSAQQFRMLLQILFMGIEYVCVKWFSIDMRGYTKIQMKAIDKYNRLLIQLGEKWGGVNGGMGPEFQLIIMILLNAILLAGAKLFSHKIGVEPEEAYETVAPLADSYINRMTSAPISKSVDPLTKTPEVPNPSNDSMFGMVTEMIGIGTTGDLMDTVTNFGGDFLAEMDMPVKATSPRPAQQSAARRSAVHGGTASAKKRRIRFGQ